MKKTADEKRKGNIEGHNGKQMNVKFQVHKIM
jgi:hypothetical protein